MRFLDNVKIAKKLPIIIVLCALLSTAIIGTISYHKAREAVIHSEETKLIALQETRGKQLDGYLDSIREDLLSVAQNPFTLEALESFESAWGEAALQGSPTEILQRLYIDDNPHPTGEKENLDYAHDGSSYSRAHAAYHP